MAFVGILISFLFSNAQAFSESDLKAGDLLLQSIPCYVCSLIEIEEGQPYSHIGVVLTKNKKISVLQSWQKVQALTLKDSLALRTPGSATLVLRAIDENERELKWDAKKLNTIFERDFAGLSYDEDFLWDNRDAIGEKLYCSEFVAKFINRFLPVQLSPQPMHFIHYRTDWISYFHGTPPDGKLGLSPSDFLESPLFKTVGELKSDEDHAASSSRPN